MGEYAILDRIVARHLSALHDGDVEAILADLATDVEVDVIGTSDQPLRGHEAVRALYREQLAASIHEQDVALRRYYGAGLVVDESLWEGRISGSLFGLEGGGRHVRYRVLRLFEVLDNVVVRLCTWVDGAEIKRQLG